MRAVLLVLFLLAGPALAVQPDEMLADPALEARAQALDEQIRCVVCRGQVIASSDADWAHDARLIVRERIMAGDTDQEVLDFFVARYGDFVLMRPRMSGANILLWAAGPIALILGGLAYWRLRRRLPHETQPALSAEEKARLDRLMGEDR
ncbi:MAG: cytochrome c-type biogenesis protein CcmH [Alphaproteobacteria bacterium]|nr:MAG: cytochrome c-type biogenesis protein CcmH [Alphaproteobacteria bacterium]